MSDTCLEVSESTPIQKATFVYKNIGPSMEHNYLCAVCRENSAIIELWNGILQPCRTCQKLGYRLLKLNWIDRLFRRGKIVK